MKAPDGVCVTCADYAGPAVVIQLLTDGMAVVRPADTAEAAEEISVALVSATVGDVVLVHASEAIAVLGPEATL